MPVKMLRCSLLKPHMPLANSRSVRISCPYAKERNQDVKKSSWSSHHFSNPPPAHTGGAYNLNSFKIVCAIFLYLSLIHI